MLKSLKSRSDNFSCFGTSKIGNNSTSFQSELWRILNRNLEAELFRLKLVECFFQNQTPQCFIIATSFNQDQFSSKAVKKLQKLKMKGLSRIPI